MSLAWNPNAPSKIGNEHQGAGISNPLIDDLSKQYGLRFVGKHTGAIQAIDLFAGAGASAPMLDARYGSLNRPMFIDLVPAGSEASGVVAQTQAAPSAVSSSANMYNQSLGSPTLAAITSPDDGNFMVASALNAYVDIAFDTAAFPLDQQILRVGLRIDSNATFRLSRIDPSGAIRWYKDIPTLGASPYAQFIYQGDAKVDQGATTWSWWTPQDIRDLRSGSTRRFRIQCKAGPGVWKLDYVRLYVIHVPERRIGAGIGSPVNFQQWFQFDMKGTDGTGDPSITTGAEYTAIVRRALTTSTDSTMSHATLPWRHLKGEVPGEAYDTYKILTSTPPDVGNSPIFLSGALKTDGLGDLVPGIATARFINAGSATDETQPYSLMRGAVVDVDHTATQELTIPAGTEVFGQAMAMIGRRNMASSEPLRVRMVDSGGNPVFSEVQVTPADWQRQPMPANPTDDQGYTYKLMRFRFPESLDLVGAANYQLQFVSDTPIDAQWRVGVLMGAEHGSPDRTFGGAVDEAVGTYQDSTRYYDLTTGLSADLQAVLATVPLPVENLRLSLGVVSVNHTNVPETHVCDSGCADQGLPYLRLEWDPAPSGNTAYYEIQRSTVYKPDWVYVGKSWGHQTTLWDDQEAPIGIKSRYRIRPVQPDEVAGEWSEVVEETIPRGYVALSFSSNAATGMACTYNEAFLGSTVGREWDVLDSEDTELRQMYGEDGQRAFRPVERKGIAFERRLLVSALRAIPSPSLSVADALRLLAWAPVPYVCVRDGEGNVFYATVMVGSIENERSPQTDLWYLPVQVIETTGPFMVDNSVAQITGADVGLG